LEKPVKGPGFSLKSKEAVPKTEVLEQPQLHIYTNRLRKFYIYRLTLEKK
jgi:hypothetical protein